MNVLINHRLTEYNFIKKRESLFTGEKPFKCETCGRAFIQKEILKRHIMIHTGERPFQCLKCDKSFILRDTLKQHINRHHLKTPIVETHECPLCPKVRAKSMLIKNHFNSIEFLFSLFPEIYAFIRFESPFTDSRGENIQL